MEEPGVDTTDNDYDDEADAPDGGSLSTESSVFGDDKPSIEDDSDSGDENGFEYVEHPGASVFDVPPADPAQQSVFEQGDADALDADPWANEPTSGPEDDWQTSGDQTIALDVEPNEPDDLEAWSVLGSASPRWDDSAAEGGAGTWDPGPAPTLDEPEAVLVGERSERFFTFEDGGGGEGGFVDDSFVTDDVGGSDMQTRILTGAVLLAAAVAAIWVGPPLALALIVLIVALSAGEFFNAIRVAGYQPATLLGLTAAIAMPLAVYWRGQQAVPLILALSVVFGLIWFLLGISTEIPVMNLGVTLFGIMYIGLLGSFGASLLNLGTDEAGAGLLLAAIVVTIAYDIGAFFAGRSVGRTPLTSVSPNKTVEGLVGGAIASVVASMVIFGLVKAVEPFDSSGTFLDSILLGLVGAIIAPLGDLAESLIKRDLGIKDMGAILPGHGGFLDRFDALLFVLPAVYFLSLALFY